MSLCEVKDLSRPDWGEQRNTNRFNASPHFLIELLTVIWLCWEGISSLNSLRQLYTHTHTHTFQKKAHICTCTNTSLRLKVTVVIPSLCQKEQIRERSGDHMLDSTTDWKTYSKSPECFSAVRPITSISKLCEYSKVKRSEKYKWFLKSWWRNTCFELINILTEVLWNSPPSSHDWHQIEGTAFLFGHFSWMSSRRNYERCYDNHILMAPPGPSFPLCLVSVAA